MSNKKQTAVEWLINEINSLFEKYQAKEISERDFITMKHNLFYPAKEMEKEQIIDAWIATDNELQRIAAEQYYNETFKPK